MEHNTSLKSLVVFFYGCQASRFHPIYAEHRLQGFIWNEEKVMSENHTKR